jgi:hypothetical protein
MMSDFSLDPVFTEIWGCGHGHLTNSALITFNAPPALNHSIWDSL